MRTFVFIAAAASIAIAPPALAQKQGMTKERATTQAEKRFARIDTDSNGQITSAELTSAMQAAAAKNGGELKEKRVARMLKQQDTDGNGQISLAEFRAAALAKFDAADLNKNGTIDAGEGKAGGGQSDD